MLHYQLLHHLCFYVYMATTNHHQYHLDDLQYPDLLLLLELQLLLVLLLPLVLLLLLVLQQLLVLQLRHQLLPAGPLDLVVGLEMRGVFHLDQPLAEIGGIEIRRMGERGVLERLFEDVDGHVVHEIDGEDLLIMKESDVLGGLDAA